MDSTSVKGDRIEGQGGKGVANRKEAPEEEISSLRLIRLSESMDRILESFRASWLSRLLSSFLAKKQVSRENTGDNGRPPVKLGSFKRLGGRRAAGVVLSSDVLLHLGGLLVSAFSYSPTEQRGCNNLIKMSGFPRKEWPLLFRTSLPEGGLFEQVLEGLGRSRIIRRQDY